MLRPLLVCVSLLGALAAPVPGQDAASARPSASGPPDEVAADSWREVTLDDGQVLAVRDLGQPDGTSDVTSDPTPLVLLTGGPGFAGSQLLGLAEALAGEHQVFLPDQRGTGRSVDADMDAAAYTMDGAVADLEQLRAALGLERMILVGHSWGGLLAMAYAAAHGERAEALVLLDPAGIDSSFWGPYQTNIMARLQRARPENVAAVQSLRPEGDTLEDYVEFMREANRLMLPGSFADADGEALGVLGEQVSDPERFAPQVAMAMQPSLLDFDLRHELEDFPAPVLVVQGEQDPMGEDVVRRMAETFQHARLVRLPDAGHWPFVETPEALLAVVRPFLADPRGAAAKADPEDHEPAGASDGG